ncbi:MAG TPA: sialidase family protein, partial [Thermoanaerobaculia bacterium]
MTPNLSPDGGTVLLSWLEPPHSRVKPQDGNYALRFSRLVNGQWTEPVTIASGTDFFANWADFPSVTAGARGRMVAHWAAKSGADTYAYDVRLARSDDGGKTWRPIGPAHDDRTPTEHGFVSAVPEGDRVRIFWLDGRETGGGKGSMTLRTALVGDHVGKADLLDSRVCDCCQTAAAVTSSGPIVAYRDRSEDEIRDVVVVRRNADRWTAPRPVSNEGWKIEGCPVNGPAIAASGRRVAVAWFTQGGNRPRVQVAFSEDAGASFAPPVVVDRNGPLGRVDVVLDENGDALVLWVASEGKAAAIRLARVTPAGKVGTALAVS